MSAKYWIGVACKSHVEFGREKGFCAFSHGKEQAVAKLSAGDRFIYYATRERFENGAPAGDAVQAFLASGSVLDEEPREGDFAGFPAFIRAARYDAPFHIPVKPLLDQLDFITNPRYWGMAFRRSLFAIGKPDFKRILEAANAR